MFPICFSAASPKTVSILSTMGSMVLAMYMPWLESSKPRQQRVAQSKTSKRSASPTSSRSVVEWMEKPCSRARHWAWAEAET